MKLNRFFMFVLLLLLFFNSFVSCKKESIQIANTSALQVAVVHPTNKIFVDDLTSFGTISYKTKNDVSALVSGSVLRMLAKEGSSVSRGQILAVLRNVQLESQKRQAQNALHSAEATLESTVLGKWDTILGVEARLLSIDNLGVEINMLEIELSNALESLSNKTDLHSIGGITDSAFKSEQLAVQALETRIKMKKNELSTSLLGFRDEDLITNGYVPSVNQTERKNQLIDLNSRRIMTEIASAEAGVFNARNNLESIDALIEELTIRSPVRGIVGAKYFETGEYIEQNGKVFTIIDISAVSAVFSIQEQDISFFSIGSLLQLDIQSMQKKIDSRISEISPMADPQSGNFSIKADIQNQSGLIKPGMFVKCTIPKNKGAPMLTLPESVVVKKTGIKVSVFCVVSNILVSKEIIVKMIKDGTVWVESGINENDAVVIHPSPFLQEGKNVEIF